MTAERAEKMKEEIMSGPSLPEGPCPLCHAEPETFRTHQKRTRTWWLNSAGTVIKVLGWICRAICPLCRGRFTHQPEYSLPGKRYVREDIEEIAESYLETESATLFSTLGEHGYPEHEEPIPPSEESYTARSTVWRWTDWLGQQQERLRNLRSWIQHADPTSAIARCGHVISLHKYRSIERMHSLHTARDLLMLQPIFRELRKRLNSTMGATQPSGP